MSNRNLLSLNNQQLNGNVRRLSEKFENLFEIKTESNEQLFSPKSQLFTSIQQPFENKKKKTHILMTRSDTISIYNTNANTDLSNQRSISIRDSLLNLISNKELMKIVKQILVGGSVGALAGSLLGQTNLKAKLVGLLTITLFTGEHIANFTQWTSLNLGKLEYSNPKVPYSNSFGIMKNIDSFFGDNMPTIVSFLFTSVLSSTIKMNSLNNLLNLPFIDQQNLILPLQTNVDRSCLCSCHYQLSTKMQFIPILSSTNKNYHINSSS